MAQDLHRRLWQVLIVVGSTRLPKVLEFPRLVRAGLDVRSLPDSGQYAQLLESRVRARSPAQEYGFVRAEVLRQDSPEMSMHDMIHRPVKRLAGLHAAIEQPSPLGPPLKLSIRGLWVPRHVPPEDRFVEGSGLPDRAGIDAVVEEHDQCGSPVPPHGKRAIPTPGAVHLVRLAVERGNVGLRQVVPAGDVSLVPRLREAGRGLDQLLFPRPGEDGAEVFAGLVRGATRVRPLLREGALVDPVEELAELLVL